MKVRKLRDPFGMIPEYRQKLELDFCLGYPFGIKKKILIPKGSLWVKMLGSKVRKIFREGTLAYVRLG